MRRALCETLVDVVSAMGVTSSAESGLRVSSFMMNLPMEIALLGNRDRVELYADVPRWRWATDFDAPISRLKITGRVETGSRVSTPKERFT